MTNPDLPVEPPKSWPDLTRAVDDGQGVYSATMATLRDLEGAGRTGHQLLSAIEARLRELGLGHLPGELPKRQEERVIIYRRGTHFGEVVKAIEEGVGGSAGDALISIARKVNRVAEAGPVMPVAAVRGAFSDLERLLSGDGNEGVID